MKYEYSQELYDYLREGQNPVYKGYDTATVINCLLDEIDRLQEVVRRLNDIGRMFIEDETLIDGKNGFACRHCGQDIASVFGDGVHAPDCPIALYHIYAPAPESELE